MHPNCCLGGPTGSLPAALGAEELTTVIPMNRLSEEEPGATVVGMAIPDFFDVDGPPPQVPRTLVDLSAPDCPILLASDVAGIATVGVPIGRDEPANG